MKCFMCENEIGTDSTYTMCEVCAEKVYAAEALGEKCLNFLIDIANELTVDDREVYMKIVKFVNENRGETGVKP